MLACAGTLFAQKGAGKPGKGALPPAKMMPKAGGAKAGGPKGEGVKINGGPHLNNPANQFERLLAMPPEKREQVIEKLPPGQQQRLRTRLAQFDQLPPQQKALRLEMLNRYFALPAERQEAYSRQVQAFNGLEPERRQAVIRELRQLWKLPAEKRQARLGSEDFKTRFSPAELQMLGEISAANVLPK